MALFSLSALGFVIGSELLIRLCQSKIA